MLQGRRTKTRTHPHQGSQGAAPAQENETFQDYKVGDEVEITDGFYYNKKYTGKIANVTAVIDDHVFVSIGPLKGGMAFKREWVRLTKEVKVLKILRQWKATR